MKLNLTALKGIPAKEESKYPVYPDTDGKIAPLIKDVLELKEKKKTIEGKLKVEEAEVKQTVLPFYIDQCKSSVPSSIVLQSGDQEALLIFQNKYSKPDMAAIHAIVGKKFPQLFSDTFDIAIDGDVVMEKAGKKSQELIDKLTSLFTEYGCSDAITCKEACLPVENFHQLRHQLLTPEQNVEMQAACPMTIAIKAR